jgi:epoxyqueuosine reductase
LSKILLHTCCGPCTTYVNEWLQENNYEVTGYFYNPNILPQDEYERRLLTMEHYATVVGLKVFYEPNDTRTLPGECETCYVTRLRQTARKAKELGYDYFSTTLLVSPYQKHELLHELGEQIGVEEGVKFFYHDWRDGFRQGQNKAKEMNLYRQKYCGCGVETIAKKERVYDQVS